MRYISGALGLLFIPVIVNGILGYLKCPKKAEKGKVYLPKFFAILGIIVSVVFLIPMIITAFTGEAVWIPIVFLVLSLLGVVLILAFVNCRIEYNENDFTAKNLFGIKRKYTYDQIDAIKKDMHEDYILVGKYKVMIDEFTVGGREFITFVEKQYRKLHKGHAISVVKKDRQDIFYGNVYDTGGFVFIYILLSVLIIAFGAFMAYYIWFNPSSVDNTIEKIVTFEAGVTNDDEYVMTTAQGETYKIGFWNERANRDKIESVCDGMTKLTVYVKEIKTKQGTTDYWSIQQIQCENTVISSFEENNRINQKEYFPLILFPIGAAILWGLFITGSIIVGRNPTKYSKFVKFFFKEGYVNY